MIIEKIIFDLHKIEYIFPYVLNMLAVSRFRLERDNGKDREVRSRLRFLKEATPRKSGADAQL
jgi:hypothetical protein